MIRKIGSYNSGFSLGAVITLVGLVGLLAAAVIPAFVQAHRQAQEPESVPMHYSAVGAGQKEAAIAQIKVLADNLRAYYDVAHKGDSENCQWRVSQLCYNVREAHSVKVPCIGLIEYVIVPTPNAGIVGPTGHRLQLVYEGGRWALRGVEMRMSYLDLSGVAEWRPVQYTGQDLQQISQDRLGLNRS